MIFAMSCKGSDAIGSSLKDRVHSSQGVARIVFGITFEASELGQGVNYKQHRSDTLTLTDSRRNHFWPRYSASVGVLQNAEVGSSEKTSSIHCLSERNNGLLRQIHSRRFQCRFAKKVESVRNGTHQLRNERRFASFDLRSEFGNGTPGYKPGNNPLDLLTRRHCYLGSRPEL
jgi:hypothetical protein